MYRSNGIGHMEEVVYLDICETFYSEFTFHRINTHINQLPTPTILEHRNYWLTETQKLLIER